MTTAGIVDFDANRLLTHKDRLTDMLADLFCEQSHQLNLSCFCFQGGSIGGVDISNVVLLTNSQQSGTIEGRFVIEFEESYHNGCRDITWAIPFRGRGSFRLSAEREEIEVTIDAEQVPNTRSLAEDDLEP